MLVRPPMTNFKMMVRADCAIPACSPLPPAIKTLAHWLWRRRGQSVFGQTSVPHSPVASIQNKASFPFHQSGLFFWLLRAEQLVLGSVTLWLSTGPRPTQQRHPSQTCRAWRKQTQFGTSAWAADKDSAAKWQRIWHNLQGASANWNLCSHRVPRSSSSWCVPSLDLFLFLLATSLPRQAGKSQFSGVSMGAKRSKEYTSWEARQYQVAFPEADLQRIQATVFFWTVFNQVYSTAPSLRMSKTQCPSSEIIK